MLVVEERVVGYHVISGKGSEVYAVYDIVQTEVVVHHIVARTP